MTFLTKKVSELRRAKETMDSAVAAVFKAITDTTDDYLRNKVVDFQSRVYLDSNKNLIDALNFLKRELQGNVTENREAMTSCLTSLRTAKTLGDMRFVVDMFGAVKNLLDQNIAEYGGYGGLSNSQYHYKLVSKIDRDSVQLNHIRTLIQDMNPETATIESIRSRIKPELDGAIDPLTSLGRSSIGQARASTYFAADANNIVNIATAIEQYNSDVLPTTNPPVAYATALAAQQGSNGQSNNQRNFIKNEKKHVYHRTVCTRFLYGDCPFEPIECKFDHPTGQN